MKIIFICGSLEPGKDGVGDYTRRLTSRLIELDHQASVLAFNDQFLAQVTWETQNENGVDIDVLRLPTNTSIKQKINLVRTWIQDIDPDWISLQYVPFAYQLKGLPIQLPRQLQKIGKGYKWHIMFHELWTGMKVDTSMKELWLGKLQQVLIMSMIKTLKPVVIHTQSQIYLEQLRKRGVKATQLPLFGNIPFVPVVYPQKEGNSKVQLIMFGGVDPNACIQELVNKIQDFKEKTGKQVEIVFIGRNGAGLEVWSSILAQSNIAVNIVGEQPPEKISAWFQQADAGLFTTPAMLAEKSGSVAAMLEHGLPVICVQYSWVARGLHAFKPNLPVYDIKTFDFQYLLNGGLSSRSTINLISVAEQFLNNLNV